MTAFLRVIASDRRERGDLIIEIASHLPSFIKRLASTALDFNININEIQAPSSRLAMTLGLLLWNKSAKETV